MSASSPRLITERLTLKAPQERHAESLYRALSLWEVAKGLTVPHPYTLKHAHDWITIGSRMGLHFSVFLNNTLIGGVGLSSSTQEVALLELGYWIAHEHQGQGYAYEACCALIRHSQKHLTNPTIIAKCLTGNTASQKLLANLGFEKTHEAFAYSLPYQAQKRYYYYRLSKPLG